jgi:hypothetical protein
MEEAFKACNREPSCISLVVRKWNEIINQSHFTEETKLALFDASIRASEDSISADIPKGYRVDGASGAILPAYVSEEANFFFYSCMLLNKNRESCVLDQVEKYERFVRDSKTRQSLHRLAVPYLVKGFRLDHSLGM